jgi:hypothetical protein
MSFRLEITFSGLCLFVPDSHPTAGEVIHVLMPDAGAMMKHLPRIVYSRDYEFTVAPRVKKPNAKKIVQNNEQIVDLDNFPVVDLAATLAGAVTPAARFKLPAEVLNVSDLAKLAGAVAPNHRVAKKWFRGPLPKNGACVARITIPSTQLVAYNKTDQVVVDLPGGGTKPVVGAACVTAAYEVDEAILPTLAFDVDGNPIKLKPSAGVIKLLIGNMIQEDYNHPPQPPATPMTMSHYSAFYDLLVTPPAKNKRPSPRLPGPSGLPPGGVNPVTCMTGGGCGETDLGC